MSENSEVTTTTVMDNGSENTMTVVGTYIEIDTNTSSNENITDIQNYLDLFSKEIKGNEITQMITDCESEEQALYVDQNGQYYQANAEDEQMIMVGGLSEQTLLMVDSLEDNIDNVPHIVLFSQQENMKKNQPQTITLGDDSEYLVQADPEINNYVLYTMKQNFKNDATSTDSMKISQDDSNVSNAYDFNFIEDATQPKKSIIADSGKEDGISKIVNLVPMKSQTVKQTYLCNLCKYTTEKRYLLKRHMISHSDKRPHKCNMCDHGFKTLYSLKNHINTHSGIKPHMCQSCSSAFTTSGELVRHVRYKHTHEKPHKCTICDYASVELSKMRSHMRRHTGERPYICPYCAFASPDSSKLKYHLLFKHTGEKPYKCDICFSRFLEYKSLKTHRLTHIVPEKKPVFKCGHYPITYGQKTEILLHVPELYTSDKPIKCEQFGESEKNTSIQTSETAIVGAEFEDGQQYVMLKVIQLNDQNQINSYTPTSVSILQDIESSLGQKDITVLKSGPLLEEKQNCGNEVEYCFGFKDKDDEETTNSSG